MSIDRRFLNWGIFFIVLGAVPLAVQANLLSRDVVSGLWRLWPLILIGLGLGIILRRTAWVAVGGIIVAATFGFVFGAGLAVGPDVVSCGGTPGGGIAFDRSGAFDGSASVELSPSCGTLTVTAASSSGWAVHAVSASNVAPAIDAGPGNLSVRSGRAPFLFGPSADDWSVSLPEGGTVGLSADLNAAKGRFNLGSMHLNGLSITVNAGEARADLSAATTDGLSVTVNAGAAFVALPSATDTSGSITVNAGAVNLCAPTDLGLRLNASQALGGTNFAQEGLVQSGNTWTSANYATAQHKADISLTVNLGSATLNPTGGCK